MQVDGLTKDEVKSHLQENMRLGCGENHDSRSDVIDDGMRQKVVPRDDHVPPHVTEEFYDDKEVQGDVQQKPRKYFYYDTPHSEETGAWIPVSVPSMLENDLGFAFILWCIQAICCIN